MATKKLRYAIIKEMTDENGKVIRILLDDGMSEVYETSSKEKAESLAQMFNANSDSGWTYTVRQIG